jgi:hypothetical protein
LPFLCEICLKTALFQNFTETKKVTANINSQQLSSCRGGGIRTHDPLLPKRNLAIFADFQIFLFCFVNSCFSVANIAILS